jgi:hypothetical protein
LFLSCIGIIPSFCLEAVRLKKAFGEKKIWWLDPSAKQDAKETKNLEEKKSSN